MSKSLSRKTFGFLIALLIARAFATPSRAAATPVRNVHRDDDGVTLKFDSGILKLQVWSDRVIRVVYAPGDSLPDSKSFTVIAKPQAVKWQLAQSADAITLSAPLVHVKVDAATGAVGFYDAADQPLLLEPTAGGKSFGPTPIKNLSSQSSTQEFQLAPDEAIFGLGQQQNGLMNYRGNFVTLLQSNMHVGLPVILSSRGYGLLWDNPAVTQVDVGKTKSDMMSWSSEAADAIDYYFTAGPAPDDIVASYRQLSGAAPMFARWVFGFWQCRERYASQDELLWIVSEYRRRNIPMDVIVQDWQYWAPNPWGSHILDPARYYDPPGMMNQLHHENIHVVISVWPKFDVGTKNYNELEAAGGLFAPIIPYVFPAGQGKWYDPFNPVARQIYWRQISEKLFAVGMDGWWLDATEPELGGKWGEFRDIKTAAGPGAKVFNAYPLMTSTAVYDGQRAQSSDKRVVILTRSAYSGQQRNAAITWSGDIRGDWPTFRRQIPAGLNFSASGIPYWNTDIGGFNHPKITAPGYPELFTRWFQFGAFCPLFRVHGSHNPKEIWRFEPPIQDILTKYDELRYGLVPYIYSTAWQVTNAGYTMMRPLMMDFRTDPKALDIKDQFMFGHSILVNPVTEQGAQSRSVYLPVDGKWTNFWTGETTAGGQAIDTPAPLETLPLFIRAGSIIPLSPPMQSTTEKPADPIELRVYRGADGDFTLYEDENDNYNYEKGACATIPMHWNEAAKTLTIGPTKGEFPGMLKQRTFDVVFVTPGHGSGPEVTEKPDAQIRFKSEAVRVAVP